MRRGHVLSRWLEDLQNGDPVAIGILVVFLLFLAGVGTVAFFAKRRIDREDAASKKKWNRQ